MMSIVKTLLKNECPSCGDTTGMSVETKHIRICQFCYSVWMIFPEKNNGEDGHRAMRLVRSFVDMQWEADPV